MKRWIEHVAVCISAMRHLALEVPFEGAHAVVGGARLLCCGGSKKRKGGRREKAAREKRKPKAADVRTHHSDRQARRRCWRRRPPRLLGRQHPDPLAMKRPARPRVPKDMHAAVVAPLPLPLPLPLPVSSEAGEVLPRAVLVHQVG